MTSTNGTRPTLITSVRRALHLMEVVAGHADGAPAKKLAREAGLPLATTYHLLRTLAHEGYVRKLGDGLFVLGDRLDALREQGRPQAMLSRTRPALTALRDELDMATYLGFYGEDGEIRVRDIADGPRAPRVDVWVGFEDAAHATALGKCILRQLDDESRDDYLSRHPLLELTPRTVTRPAELIRRLARPTRYSLVFDKEEYAIGTCCAAVPVTDGTAVGALGVSCRPERLSRIEAAAERLVNVARRVTRTVALTGGG